MEMIYGMRSGISFAPGMNDMPLRFDRCRFVDYQAVGKKSVPPL
jgi:hypothetical protein